MAFLNKVRHFTERGHSILLEAQLEAVPIVWVVVILVDGQGTEMLEGDSCEGDHMLDVIGIFLLLL